MTKVQTPEQAPFTASQAVVESYFKTFNGGQYQTTAALFSPQGVLCPPFESPVQGQAAIAAYLEQEASGMKAELMRQSAEVLPDGQIRVEVRGKVQALVFQVNVGWTFLLSPQGTIDQVQVNLLASLEELLHLRS